MPKRRHLKYLERKLEEVKLSEARLQSMITEIDRLLQPVDKSSLPKALEMYEDTELGVQQNGISPASSTGTVAEKSGPSFFSRFATKFTSRPGQSTDNGGAKSKSRPARDDYCVVIPGAGRVQMTADPTAPLSDESWFHGLLPREEVQQLLKNDGDYLVRESKKRGTEQTQYVLSVMWQGPKHFIIQSAETGGWRFEGDPFPTIQELLINQHNSNMAVTNRSQAILSNPIMRESWQIKNDDIQLEEKIGNGNFGEVFKGRYRGDIVAVKTCKEELQEEQKKKFIQEGRILRQYDHPNIVKFVGIAAQRHPVMIVMEFVSGGALLQWLRKFGLSEARRTLIQMCLDAALGMEYLESKNVIHRDLAARNCLIDSTKKVKISDFGMSKEEEEYCASSGMRQIPIKWTAPEALNYGKYTSLCDVWSYGILVWEIFSAGKTPYASMKNQEARERVDQGYRMPSPDNCPHQMYTLMRECWEERPERRPHFKRIVKDINFTLKEIPQL